MEELRFELLSLILLGRPAFRPAASLQAIAGAACSAKESGLQCEALSQSKTWPW